MSLIALSGVGYVSVEVCLRTATRSAHYEFPCAHFSASVLRALLAEKSGRTTDNSGRVYSKEFYIGENPQLD